MFMDYREQILSFLNTNGPSVPTQVKNHIRRDTLMASAMLSELSSTGKILISSVKVGSSPLYYLPQHKDHLQKFSSYLHEKEQRVYGELKEKKIVRHNSSDPLTQECLRSMKDFAIPLTVTYAGNQELFWKWYLLPDEEVNAIIGGILTPIPEKKEETAKTIQPLQKIEQKKVPELHKKIITPKTKELPMPVKKEEQTTISLEEQPDPFYNILKRYCAEKNIQITSSKIVKKNKEIDLHVTFSSAVGKVSYFCKAKNKKRITHDELSSAYLEASEHKLPVLFIAPGILTKKAEVYIQTKLKGVMFSQLS